MEPTTRVIPDNLLDSDTALRLGTDSSVILITTVFTTRATIDINKWNVVSCSVIFADIMGGQLFILK